jgi:ketosteroid isomerase-like protein
LVKSDPVALAAILADGYVSTDEQGHQRDKSGNLARLKSGEGRFQSMKASDVRVHLYGNAAVVTGVNAATGTSDGQPMPAKMAFTDTFIRQNGA